MCYGILEIRKTVRTDMSWRKDKSMNKDILKCVLSWVVYAIGFIIYVVFMKLANGISDEAGWYAFGASFGTMIFTLSRCLSK